MPPQRHTHPSSRFRAAQSEVSLWHLGAGLLATGGALAATLGLPGSPWSVIVALMGSAQSGLAEPLGLSQGAEALAGVASIGGGMSWSMPSPSDLELVLRSPSVLQLDTAVVIVSWIAWVLWLWLVATTLLRIVVIVADRSAASALWSARLRAMSDRVTVSLVRHAVDATFASELVLRGLVPAPAPLVPNQVEYALVQSLATDEPVQGVPTTGHQTFMAQEIQPGDVLYTVQSGDNLSAIAQRFYGDPAAFKRIVEANLGREQPGGTTLRDARFIYPGWQLVVPDPTQSISTDSDGHRWYTVRHGDTLSEISAELLGDWRRYPELFADNDGAELGDGHVLTDPNLIWPGLRLSLPLDPEQGGVQAAQPAGPPSVPVATVTSTPTPVTATPAPLSETNRSKADTTEDSGVEPPSLVTPGPSEAPAQSSGDADDRADDHWPAWLPGSAEVELGVAGGLAALALVAISARRGRRTPPEPESDTRIDEQAFSIAEPAVVAASRAGGGADPHGIVIGELVAGEIMRHTGVAELSSAQVISVVGGRSGSVVTLSTSLVDRALLETALRTHTQLARRIDVSRSADQDVVVRLHGVRQEALSRVAVQDCPVLLCLGMLPDSRSYLASWHALGDVLVASQPGTTDAEEHLAAMVATLAGQLAPSELQLYTVASPNTALGQLAPLPHQRAVIDASDSASMMNMLRDLRAEVERRQLAGGDGAGEPQLVLVASELADIEAREELRQLLSDSHRFGVRVLAATAEAGVEHGPTVDLFSSHLVFGLTDEEASTRLLGTPWALTLAEPGRLLVRLGQRKPVEVLGLRLTEEGRLALLASMGVDDTTPATSATPSSAEQRTIEAAPDSAGCGPREVEARLAEVSTFPFADADELADSQTQTDPEAVATVPEIANEPPAAIPEPDGQPLHVLERVLDRAEVRNRTTADATPALDCPERIGTLLKSALLAVDCDQASVWSTQERLDIGLSSPVEVLLYLAAAPLLHQGRLADWTGVEPETLLREVWAPRARDPGNRDSAQTWLGKNLARLQEEISRAVGGLDAQIVLKQAGSLRLNPDVIVSDVEAFMSALERARTAQTAEQPRAAEEAFGLRPPGLLSRVVRKPKATGPRVEFFRWLGQAEWERAAGRLEALGRDAAMLLARAYRDAGRFAEALARYDELLSEEPLDRRAQEGLLIAAAGTRDLVRFEQAWQQVCACLGGDYDADVRALYERLSGELTGANSRNGNGASRVLGRGDAVKMS